MKYVQSHSDRDLRIDFMRGFVMFILVVVHIEIFSWFNLITWERIGIISGAEGFVLLSGLVLGQVHKKLIQKHGFKQSAIKLLERSAQLYFINVTIVAFVFVLTLQPLLDLQVITTFKDWGSGQVYPLFPDPATSWYRTIADIFLLKHGPHQIQILGLYVVLLAVTPLLMWLLKEGKAIWICVGSLIFYFYNWSYPVRVTGAQFEYAFPLLSWQILYVSGLVIGFELAKLKHFFTSRRYALLVGFSALMTLGFIILAWHSPNEALPHFVKINVFSQINFSELHQAYFSKNKLGILRLVNYACFLVVFYWCLTNYWSLINKALGWLFVPLGQASLYVFIMHLLFIVVIAALTDFPNYEPDYHTANIWLNTLLHSIALVGLWFMVKRELLFKYVPR